MKRNWWGILFCVWVAMLPIHVSAIATSPSDPSTIKTNGPLLITGYSFSGNSLHYVQIYNSSSSVASLDGWRISIEYPTAQLKAYKELDGLLAPSTYVVVANVQDVPSASFTFQTSVAPSDPIASSVSLLAPEASSYNNEVATPSITSTTARVAGSPARFYFSRNISSSTGNYLSTYSAFVPGQTFSLNDDGVYVPAASSPFSIVEIYADAKECSPLIDDPLCTEYVKVQNSSAESADLAGYRIRTGMYGQAASSTNTAVSTEVVAPGEFAVAPLSISSSGSYVWIEDRYGVIAYPNSLVQLPATSGFDSMAWSKHVTDGWVWTSIPTPSNEPNRFDPKIPLNSCEGVVINEIAANVDTDDQYVELLNTTDETVNVSGCIIQTNRSTTKLYTLRDSALDPGQLVAIYIRDTGLTLTKTTNGTVYLLSSDMRFEADQESYDTLAEGTSWSRIGDTWLQSYQMTPASENQYEKYPACKEGYKRDKASGDCIKLVQTITAELTDCGPGKYRSPDTNRCRSLEALATALTPCDDGQYRNPETNRCRTLTTTSSLLSPCGPGQERNPETNRCRTVSSSTSTLQPCAAGQERNPATNRCRAAVQSGSSDFPVEALAVTSEGTLGWWAFGGAGLLALGYGGWEWRSEVGSLIRKITTVAKLGR